MSEEFLVFAGGIEPLLHGDELRGVKHMDECMVGGLTWAAGEGAATTQEEFSA
jgi:hypothetical protein